MKRPIYRSTKIDRLILLMLLKLTTLAVGLASLLGALASALIVIVIFLTVTLEGGLLGGGGGGGV